MEQTIITKFTIATPDGLNTIKTLTKAIAYEKFSGIISPEVLEQYIADHYNAKELTDEMNSMSNQWLTIYVNEIAAGYARITSKGKKTDTLQEKRFIRIADFGILKEHDSTLLRESLFNKCLGSCQSYAGLWLHEYLENPLLEFFENKGFTRLENDNCEFELPLKSVFLIREHVGLSN